MPACLHAAPALALACLAALAGLACASQTLGAFGRAGLRQAFCWQGKLRTAEMCRAPQARLSCLVPNPPLCNAGARPGTPLAASRRLLGRRNGRIARHEAAERRESLLDSGGQPGDYTGWGE